MLYVRATAQIAVVEDQKNRAQNEFKCVAMKNFNQATGMFMSFFVHGKDQIPVGKTQNQAQKEIKQTHIGHQDASRYM